MIKTRIFLSVFALTLGVSAAEAQTTTPLVNAAQKREDHANHDRWGRTQSPPGASDTDKDESASSDHDAKPNDAPGHRGELNGKLHLGEW